RIYIIDLALRAIALIIGIIATLYAPSSSPALSNRPISSTLDVRNVSIFLDRDRFPSRISSQGASGLFEHSLAWPLVYDCENETLPGRLSRRLHLQQSGQHRGRLASTVSLMSLKPRPVECSSSLYCSNLWL